MAFIIGVLRPTAPTFAGSFVHVLEIAGDQNTALGTDLLPGQTYTVSSYSCVSRPHAVGLQCVPSVGETKEEADRRFQRRS